MRQWSETYLRALCCPHIRPAPALISITHVCGTDKEKTILSQKACMRGITLAFCFNEGLITAFVNLCWLLGQLDQKWPLALAATTRDPIMIKALIFEPRSTVLQVIKHGHWQVSYWSIVALRPMCVFSMVLWLLLPPSKSVERGRWGHAKRDWERGTR